MNVESIAEVKVLRPATRPSTAVERPADHAPSPRAAPTGSADPLYDVERNSDWNANSKTNILNGDSEADPEGAGPGLFDRRPDRQAGRQQQAVLLLRARVRAAHRRQRRRCASACRRRLERAGDFSQTPDNNGNLYPVHQGSALDGTCTAASTRRPASRTAAWSADPGRTVSTRPGLNILKMYPMPNVERPRPAPTTTR